MSTELATRQAIHRPHDEFTERLARAAHRSPAISLQLAGAGTFPRRAAAHVLWVGVAGDIEALTRLAERCLAAGRRTGLTMSDARFRAHLTVARARQRTVDLSDRIEAMASYAGPPWRATSLRLVRSVLGPASRHETIHEWSLPGPGDPAGAR